MTLPGYGTGVDAQLPANIVSTSTAPVDNSNDAIATEGDLSQVNAAQQASMNWSNNMVETARFTLAQESEYIPVKGSGSAYSPDELDTDQYTVPQVTDARFKVLTNKILSHAGQNWSGGSADSADATAAPAAPTSGQSYTSWMLRADSDIWTEPLGAVTMHDQDTDPTESKWFSPHLSFHGGDWSGTGTPMTGIDDQTAATAKFMGIAYQ